MAKTPPKPLFPGKHEFYASLDNFIQASLNLYQTLDTVKGDLPDPVKALVQKRLDEWKNAWSRDEE